MTQTLFQIPRELSGSAAEAQQLFDAQKFHETVSFCQEKLAGLEKQISPRVTQDPRRAEAGSAVLQYYALTAILVNALAQLEEWKSAKEVLGKYRVYFPRDPWGFSAGAEVTRRDTQVKDKAAVSRAIELLDGEAERLKTLSK